MTKFTLIWQAWNLDMGIGVYEGDTQEDAVRQWRDDTVNCDLIGIIAGDPEVLAWYP
jgi:hypothetical protein